jgi:hypothetical protein
MSKPAARVLEGLKRERNRADILSALGAPDYVPAKGWEAARDAAVKVAETQFAIAVDVLEKIARASTDPTLNKSKPTRDLDALIDLLAQHWQQMTGKTLTQDWITDDQGRREPVAPGASFVHEIIGFIDPARLRDVPGATRRVVKDRRATALSKNRPECT